MAVPPSTARRHLPSVWLGVYALVIVVLLALTLAPYHGNVSALFHFDSGLAQLHPVSPDFIVLTVPGYDGMQYYQIARNIPSLLSPAQWPALAASSPGFYAYQRILLPTLAYAVSLGQNGALPSAFLAINVLCLLGTFLLILRWERGTPLLAFALALSPAALIGLHFSLAEPLNLLLVTAFLLRFVRKRYDVDWIGALLLSLAVLTREINIFLAFGVFLIACWKRQWRSALLCIVPAIVFWLLQGWLFLIFGDMPFLTSTAKNAFPLLAPAHLLTGFHGYNVKSFSSLALLLLFVLPAFVSTVTDTLKGRADRLTLLLLLFLGLMLATADYIWGSITSIGRAITPVYPLFTIYAGLHPTVMNRMLAAAVLVIGVTSGIGLALIAHPYVSILP